MSKPYRIKEPIGPGYNMDPDDVRETKTTLSSTGHYKPPKFGITDIPDNQMIDAIRNYQKDNNLKVDGVMKPGGETERSIKSTRWEHYNCTNIIYSIRNNRGTLCGKDHDGTHGSICDDCYRRNLLNP